MCRVAMQYKLSALPKPLRAAILKSQEAHSAKKFKRAEILRQGGLMPEVDQNRRHNSAAPLSPYVVLKRLFLAARIA